jgi:hypothetical protein
MSNIVNFHHEGEFVKAGEKSDQELIEAGKVLVTKIERTNRKIERTNREIGEWFNSVKGSRGRPPKNKGEESSPFLSAREICKQAGGLVVGMLERSSTAAPQSRAFCRMGYPGAGAG